MFKAGVLFGLMTVLSACGDPLAGITRISDVELDEADPTAQALPSDEEVAREGFFGTSATQPAPENDTYAAEVPADPEVAEPPKRGGLLGLLRRAVPAAQPEVGGADDTLSQAAFDEAKSAELTPPEEQPRPVLKEEEQLATLSPEPETAPETAPKRGGLFSRLSGGQSRERAKSDLLEVDYGTVLPYGVIARNCAAKRQPLGRKVASAGANGYKLYDSNPGSTGLRTFYIMGFDDGCPRQLTAAHVLLGAPSLYEVLHYGPTGQHLTFGATDKAYEKVKSRVCGVRKGKPCGAKMRKLERDTFFVNSYERADDNTTWSELLVHDGQVVATSLKTSG